MKILLLPLLALSSLPLFAQMAMDHPAQPGTVAAPERLGTVSFSVSCAADVQAPFNRGVALLHDFWYEEADRQFEEIAKADPGCAMAHWGAAMSFFHQIWNRPSESSVAQGWAEIQKAQSPSAKTARERAYIAALRAGLLASDFLLSPYLQSGQDDCAKWVLDQTTTLLHLIAVMPIIPGRR